MKLLICICQNQYASPIIQKMVDHGYRSTKLASSGGFLKKGNTTLLIGIHDRQKEEVIRLIEQACDETDRKRAAQKDAHRVTLFVVHARPGKQHDPVDNPSS